MTAIEMLKTFKAEGERCLTKKDIAFCHDLIRNGVVGMERIDAVSNYIIDEKKEEFRRDGLDAAERLGNYFENYLTVSQGLLFSHTGKKPASSYYRPAPADMKSVIVVLPDKGILIKTENFEDGAWYGDRRDKSGMLIVVKIFMFENEWRLLYDGSFIDTFYPRYSMYCLRSSKCDKYNPKQMRIVLPEHVVKGSKDYNDFKAECFMGRNGVNICNREIFSGEEYGLTLTDYYAIAVESFERWQRRPIRSGTQKTESYNDYGVCALTVETPPDGNLKRQEFKEVRLKEYHSYTTSRRLAGWTVANRLSPHEHERREHPRTLASGKTIMVKKAIVNKGKGKTVYKVD